MNEEQITIEFRCPIKPGSNPKLLHVGCGEQEIPKPFTDQTWEETTLDIDPITQPDICCDVCDMRSHIKDMTFHCVWWEAGLEHLSPHQVSYALLETNRVLVPGGALYLSVPDMEFIALAILRGDLDKLCYTEGNRVRVTYNDVIYGHADSIRCSPAGHHMQHRIGFTRDTLTKRLHAAHFNEIVLSESGRSMIQAVAYKGWAINYLRWDDDVK